MELWAVSSLFHRPDVSFLRKTPSNYQQCLYMPRLAFQQDIFPCCSKCSRFSKLKLKRNEVFSFSRPALPLSPLHSSLTTPLNTWMHGKSYRCFVQFSPPQKFDLIFALRHFNWLGRGRLTNKTGILRSTVCSKRQQVWVGRWGAHISFVRQLYYQLSCWAVECSLFQRRECKVYYCTRRECKVYYCTRHTELKSPADKLPAQSLTFEPPLPGHQPWPLVRQGGKMARKNILNIFWQQTWSVVVAFQRNAV